jgi:glycosyltransferase involved in cell wall biosynthesis
MMRKKERKLKRICMLSTHGYFDPVPRLGQTDTGGQVVYVLELAKALTGYGVKVDIYTRWCDQSRPQVDPVPDFPDVRVIRIPCGPSCFVPKEEIYDVLPELVQSMIAFIRANDLDYDLFHGHYVDAGIVTLDVARALDRPAFFTAHSLGAWKRERMGGDPDEMEKKFRFSYRIAEEMRIFHSVRAQTVTTAVQQEKLEQLYGFTSDNITVIPPGVNVHTFRPPVTGETEVEKGLPERYIFCLSRIDTNKGHDFLLHAFDIVRQSIPDIHLVIGGGSHEPEQRELGVLSMMKEIIAEKGLENRVRLTGYIPDESLVGYYQQAELFAMPSLFEPFGMTVQEAMACGRAVIASRLGGIREVISSGWNGLLVDPSNTEEFADTMLKLLKDRHLRDIIGERGRQTIREGYSWEAIARRHLEFYRKYLDS